MQRGDPLTCPHNLAPLDPDRDVLRDVDVLAGEGPCQEPVDHNAAPRPAGPPPAAHGPGVMIACHRHSSLTERPDRSCAGVVDAHVDAPRLQASYPPEGVDVVTPGCRVHSIGVTGRRGGDGHENRGGRQCGCAANSKRVPTDDPHVPTQASSQCLQRPAPRRDATRRTPGRVFGFAGLAYRRSNLCGIPLCDCAMAARIPRQGAQRCCRIAETGVFGFAGPYPLSRQILLDFRRILNGSLLCRAMRTLTAKRER